MNSATWLLGIPVRDRNRAMGFYSALLGTDLERDNSALLQFEEREDADPASLRLKIGCIEEALAIVWSNGGCVLEAERQIEGRAPYALVMDTEGNRLTLVAE
jgi:predicted enzyme related to lactoylglutathione lyase